MSLGSYFISPGATIDQSAQLSDDGMRCDYFSLNWSKIARESSANGRAVARGIWIMLRSLYGTKEHN
jgi:hypothetical protein